MVDRLDDLDAREFSSGIRPPVSSQAALSPLILRQR